MNYSSHRYRRLCHKQCVCWSRDRRRRMVGRVELEEGGTGKLVRGCGESWPFTAVCAPWEISGRGGNYLLALKRVNAPAGPISLVPIWMVEWTRYGVLSSNNASMMFLHLRISIDCSTQLAKPSKQALMFGCCFLLELILRYQPNTSIREEASGWKITWECLLCSSSCGENYFPSDTVEANSFDVRILLQLAIDTRHRRLSAFDN